MATNAKIPPSSTPQRAAANAENSALKPDVQFYPQLKLEIGKPGDSYEQEADSVAERVMRSEETFLQKKCASCEQEEKVQRQSEEEEELQMKPLLQMKKSTEQGTITTPWIEQQINLRRGSGQKLPEQTRSFMENGVGASFQNVNVHTDSTSVQMNRELGAKAFTVGNDIFFNAGQYSPETGEGKRLLAHELTHTVQQGTTSPIVQKKTELHDLTSAELKGSEPNKQDDKLEKVYDGFGHVAPTQKGPHVGRIQKALLKLGYKLPVFGVDEDYGGETKGQVKLYQRDAGLSITEQDGNVDFKTIGLMDRDLRQGMVGGDTDKKSGDDDIGKYYESAKEPLMFFYTQGKWQLDTFEREKLKKAVAKHGHKPWTLRGFASDEGSDLINEKLANERARKLGKVAQEEFGYENIITFDDEAWEVGQNNVNYAYFRSTKVVPLGDEDKDFDHKCEKDKATAAKCDPDSNLEKIFVAAHAKATTLLQNAIDAFPMSDSQVSLFDELFDVNGNKKLRKEREVKVKKRLLLMQKHLARMADEDLHQCDTGCHPICQSGSPAFNTDKVIIDPITKEKMPNTEGVMTLCPAIENFDQKGLPIVLIHEGHHGTPGFLSRDEAYNNTRALALLNFDRAMSNAGTFHVFVAHLNGINFKGSTIGPGFKDEYDPTDSFTTEEQQKANEGVAWPHQWVIRAHSVMSSTYSYMADIRNGKDSYSNPEKEGLKDFIDNLAFDFGITKPEAKPTEPDLVMVAAIYDRLGQMIVPFNSPFKFSKSHDDGTSWEIGPGQNIRLSDHYFNSELLERLNIMLQELTHATPGISPDREPHYIRIIRNVKDGLGLGP